MWPTLADDLQELVRNEPSVTTRKSLVDARIGQGEFRCNVLQQWGNTCAVTAASTLEVIRASHIKPWCESLNEERLDPFNGLPLIATIDALFDAGLISFDANGTMLISPRLSGTERGVLGIHNLSLRKPPHSKTVAYLEYHRSEKYQA